MKYHLLICVVLKFDAAIGLEKRNSLRRLPDNVCCAACGCSRVLYLLILIVLLSSYIVSLPLNLIRTRSSWFGDYNSAAVYWIITFILDILKGI